MSGRHHNTTHIGDDIGAACYIARMGDGKLRDPGLGTAGCFVQIKPALSGPRLKRNGFESVLAASNPGGDFLFVHNEGYPPLNKNKIENPICPMESPSRSKHNFTITDIDESFILEKTVAWRCVRRRLVELVEPIPRLVYVDHWFCRPFLSHHTGYRDLETFVTGQLRDVQPAADLVRRHETLQKLCVAQSYRSLDTHSSFDELLVPALEGGRFNNLRSLLLVWGVNGSGSDRVFEMSSRSLTTICQLTSLEKLAFGCNIAEFHHFEVTEEDPDDEYDPGYKDWEEGIHQWCIDHGSIRAQLTNLKNLKKLAFIGDTYQRPAADGEMEDPGKLLQQPISYRRRFGGSEKQPRPPQVCSIQIGRR
ncbi:hypothetical protein FGRMN_6322 [Fusarium graminum]|nr:hypothetical protein FGRMN_6322 [Fusarium graminum]